jgi:hypothetical protein
MPALSEKSKIRDYSYLRRFMMHALALGEPLIFSIHCMKIRESEQGVFTFTLKSRTGQESWPEFIGTRADAMLSGFHFLKSYQCCINLDLDIDEQYVKSEVNT